MKGDGTLIQQAFLRKNSYQDSVKLMQLTEKMTQLPGVTRAFAVMGTENNKATLTRAGFKPALLEGAGPNDILFAVETGTKEEGLRVWEEYQRALEQETKKDEGKAQVSAASLKSASSLLSGANLSIISVPGQYAAYEAYKALREGLHVHIFSDNVSLEDEIKLKKLGRQKGLLVMGPDCGTSILSGVPICFANSVRRGSIGIVGASGTGIQEVSVLIDRLGAGVSQAIGVGGRDLQDGVGGITSIMALKLLDWDPQTEVIVFLSKLPGKETLGEIRKHLAQLSKPVVVFFLGYNPNEQKGVGQRAKTLEEAAHLAVSLSKKESGPLAFQRDFAALFPRETLDAVRPGQYLRGLYSGGTLAGEAYYLAKKHLQKIEYNPLVPGGHAIFDLGDDQFTQGRPHPMLDPQLRSERLLQEWADPQVAVILLDVVLGFGSSPEASSSLAAAIEQARSKYGGEKIVLASLCGTDRDPQPRQKEQELLEKAGVFVLPSNAAAADAALYLCQTERSNL